jgi:hypothetical protein
MRDLFYTVLCDRPSYPVRYINRQTCHTGYFTGPFRDPGAASQEFQACVGGTTWDCHYLDEQQWPATACALIQQHRQALAAWHRWQALSSGQQTPVEERRP